MLGRDDLMECPLSAEQAYDLSAPFYDGWYWQAFWRAHEFPVISDDLAKFRRGRGRSLSVLDVGCGTGWYLNRLQGIAGDRVGIDLSEGMLAVARHRLRNVMLKRADARRVPFADARFDVVLCTRMLSHLQEIGPAVAEMRRVLSDRGMLILSDVDAKHDYEHTKLPVASGEVFATTYKHDRLSLFSEVERVGFVTAARYLIHLDGSLEQERPNRRTRIASPIAGWVGVWRRAVTSASTMA